MNGLIACLFYVTSWEISIVYLLSTLCTMEPSYFDGVDNVMILFDDKDGLFEGGQPLSGRIRVIVTSVTRIRNIKLYITGRMRIKWIDVENGSQINYEELDFPISETLTIH